MGRIRYGGNAAEGMGRSAPRCRFRTLFWVQGSGFRVREVAGFRACKGFRFESSARVAVIRADDSALCLGFRTTHIYIYNSNHIYIYIYMIIYTRLSGFQDPHTPNPNPKPQPPTLYVSHTVRSCGGAPPYAQGNPARPLEHTISG